MPRLTKPEKFAVWSFPALVLGSIVVFLLYVGGSWIIFKVQQFNNNQPSDISQGSYSLTLPCKDKGTTKNEHNCAIIHNDRENTYYQFSRDIHKTNHWLSSDPDEFNECSPRNGSQRLYTSFERTVGAHEAIFCTYVHETGFGSANAIILKDGYDYSFSVSGPFVGDHSYYIGELESLVATLELN